MDTHLVFMLEEKHADSYAQCTSAVKERAQAGHVVGSSLDILG